MTSGLVNPIDDGEIEAKRHRCLVVGAGEVGLEQVEALLACGADVSLVAPDAHPELIRLVPRRSISWKQREYRPEDLDGCLVAIAATDRIDVNTRVFEDADRRGMLVSVVDVPPVCNFFLPAIRTEPLALAISVAGCSAALAKRMKREIGALLGDEYAVLAVLLNEARAWARATLSTYKDRNEFFESIVNGQPDSIELLREGRLDDVRQLIDDAMRTHAHA